jgi:hypothetical protein
MFKWGYRFHLFLAYFSGLNFRDYPPKIWPEKWYHGTVPPSIGSWVIPIDSIFKALKSKAEKNNNVGGK